MKFESKHKPLLPRAEFLERTLARLFPGVAGYHCICGPGRTLFSGIAFLTRVGVMPAPSISPFSS